MAQNPPTAIADWIFLIRNQKEYKLVGRAFSWPVTLFEQFTLMGLTSQSKINDSSFLSPRSSSCHVLFISPIVHSLAIKLLFHSRQFSLR